MLLILRSTEQNITLQFMAMQQTGKVLYIMFFIISVLNKA